jgi:hypothetical protein
MPSSSAKVAETNAYNAVRATSFTRIHGRPTRNDYELLKKEASDLASKVENITFTWSRDTATGDEYGLLAEIIGPAEYTHLTNLNWNQETEPAAYDPAIQATTAVHTRKRMEEEWEEKRESWFIRKGFLRGATMNMRDAFDEEYYLQLKNINTAYRNTTPIQILDHLDTRWCPLDVRTRKLLKAEFHADWDNTVMHITAFGMKLDKEQARIDRLGIVISDEDKLQFYMEQIYASKCFDKKEMVDWENKPIAIKDDYEEAKMYSKAWSGILKLTRKTAVATPAKKDKRAPTKWQTSVTKSGSTFRKLPALQSPTTKKQPSLQPTSAKNPKPKMLNFRQ